MPEKRSENKTVGATMESHLRLEAGVSLLCIAKLMLESLPAKRKSRAGSLRHSHDGECMRERATLVVKEWTRQAEWPCFRVDDRVDLIRKMTNLSSSAHSLSASASLSLSFNDLDSKGGNTTVRHVQLTFRHTIALLRNVVFGTTKEVSGMHLSHTFVKSK